MILGIDVGGTFTDFVLLDEAGRVRIHKLLTTARDPSLAILRGIDELQAGLHTAIVHGATVATNALLERRGARTALITTSGFGDILEIGRQTRSDLYALHPSRPDPLVPASWRFELPERIDKDGRVLIPLNLDHTDAVIRKLVAERIESVAVCFLFSFVDSTHEQKVRERIRSSGEATPFVSLSSDILPEYREYERTSTTVINAYVAPLMGRYLSKLEQTLEGRRLRIMQSNGGALSAEAARTLAARTALSGPAGGVVASFELARMAGFDQVITFDMGGTSTDVSLCPGKIQETTEGHIAGLPLRLPMIDIHTVGAGGGSIAELDAGGALRVGPQSAGSEPGPVCYGREQASELTVTDANLVLGRLHPEHFLGGRMKLHETRAMATMAGLAQALALPPEAAAWGVVRVANSNMERAIRTISVERGHDPRDFALVAYGGAGPLHACELAAALRIPRVLIPPQPGVLSALGMILADVVKDYSQTIMLPAADASAKILDRLFAPLYERARADLRQEGFADTEINLLPSLDMRYVGQSYELTVEARAEGRAARDGQQYAMDFHQAHQRRFSYASEGEPAEIVNLRLKALGRTSKPRFTFQPLGDPDPAAAYLGSRKVHFVSGDSPHSIQPTEAGLYQRERLTPGNRILGPAILVQLDATTILPPDWVISVDGWGNLIAERD